MGMDVYGRNPTSTAGDYFRANVWSWRPIHALIRELCSDIINEKTLNLMSPNDGAGPRSQKICTEMAIRFENWREHHVDGLTLECSDCRVNSDGCFVSQEQLAQNPDMETHSPYHVADDHLKTWIEFLRECGGFKVC